MVAIRRPSWRCCSRRAAHSLARADGRARAAAITGPAADETAPGFVRFTVNWGERGGAAANRLLGHICRRGQVGGRMIGAIEIGPDESSFDVEASVAERFAKLVRVRDSRDPHLKIFRAGEVRGSRGPEGKASGKKPFGPKKSFGGKKRWGGKRKERK